MQKARKHNPEWEEKSIKTNQETAQRVLEDMNIKPVITVFSMFKKLQKRQNMKSIHMEDIKKTEFLEVEIQYLKWKTYWMGITAD